MTKVYDMTMFFQENIIYQFAEIGIDVQSTDTDAIIALRKLLFIAYKFVITFKGQVICLDMYFVFIHETKEKFSKKISDKCNKTDCYML